MAAEAFAIAVTEAETPEQWTTAIKGQAQAEAGLGHGGVVRELVAAVLARDGACDLDLAYVLLRVGADAEALDLFDGACATSMTATQHLDAAYAARRLVRNDDAVRHFEQALSKGRGENPPAFDAAIDFGIKRAVDGLERNFGLTAGAFYRGDRSPAGGGSVGQGIVEAYWQPPVIGNREGRILQLYGRASLNALTPGSAVQTDSTQGAVGVRYKPLADLNLMLAGERLFPIGDSASSDWMLRAGYSAGFNTDLQPGSRTYPTGQIYGEVAYLVAQDRVLGTLEARTGFDRQLLPHSSRLLGSVFVSGTYSYDSAERTTSATAAGVGAGLRYWFRETAYRAPASFIQFDIIYRFKIGPTDRAAGLVLQSSISF